MCFAWASSDHNRRNLEEAKVSCQIAFGIMFITPFIGSILTGGEEIAYMQYSIPTNEELMQILQLLPLNGKALMTVLISSKSRKGSYTA